MLTFLGQAEAGPEAAAAAESMTDPSRWMNMLTEKGPDFAIQVLTALAILIVGRIVAGAIRNSVKKVMIKRGVDPSLTGFVGSLIYFAIMAFTLIAVVGKFGVQTASFVAILGAAGFAVGMALQGTLGNFSSGVMLLLFRPFKAGDVIEAAGVKGKVVEIAIFSTTICTPDNVKIIVPNGSVFGGTIKNFNGYDTRRVDMVMGIGYGSDHNRAMQILADLAKNDSRVLDDPETTIAVSELADSSVNIIFRPWVNSADYWGVYLDMHKNVKEAFDAAGIDIPFPQTVVHLEKTEA
ncbi:MAG: mechanosensitive ion channel domain-containing protein [Candidatus Krumholzibacteriota bacterium]